MLAVTGKRTIEHTRGPYNELLTYLDAVAKQASLIKEVHPDKAERTAAGMLRERKRVSSAPVDQRSLHSDETFCLDFS